MKKKYKPIVYIEGIQIPIVNMQAAFKVNEPMQMSLEIPALKQLEPIYNISTDDIPEADPEVETDLEQVCVVTASGIQPYSRAQVFLKDVETSEEYLLGEGFIISVTKNKVADIGSRMQLTITGDLNYVQECQMYMADLSRSLGITQGFTSSRSAVASSDTIVNKLTDKGLVDGLYDLLKDAGTGANDYLNLVWRLYRYAQKFAIVNNPKALGYFNKTRLKSILNKQLSNIPNKQPVISMILAVLQMVRYIMIEVPSPTFVNVSYPDTQVPSMETDLEYDDALKMNKIIFMPKLQFSPPPRCNVIFPNQYDQYTFSQVFAQDPTRGYSRISKTATLTGTEGDDKLIILPEDVKEGVREHGQYWSSYEEKYRGQRMCAFNYERPEFIDDFGSDYIKAFMEIEYYTYKYRGNSLQINCSFNIDLVPGFPILILLDDGNHKIAYLDAVQHSYVPKQGMATQCTLSFVREYTAKTPTADSLWFEQAMFGQENIGYHIYPTLLGQKYCYTILDDEQYYIDDLYMSAADARAAGYIIDESIEDDAIVDISELPREDDEGEGEEEPEEINTDEDMSILRVLNVKGKTTAEIKEIKKSPEAIRNATDIIFAEYNASGNKEKYAYNFGRRIPIGIRQCMEQFYKATGSSDKFTFAGGYTLQTNSLNLVDEDNEYVDKIGEPIPEDADIAGCFYREKQEAILMPINILWSLVTDHIADSGYIEGDENLIQPPIIERPIEDIQAELEALEESSE